MKQVTLLLCLALFSKGVTAQLTTMVDWTEKSSMSPAEVIYYKPSRSLEWENFKGNPAVGPAAAITVSGFGYSAGINSRNGKGQLKINVYCYFNKNKSWVKPGKNIPYILNHEQHHFDISYVAAKLFMEKLQSTVFTVSNYNALLPRIYDEYCSVMNKMQDDYDGQTKNGQLKEVQSRWNEMLESKLGQLTK